MKFQDSATYKEAGLSKVWVKHNKKLYQGNAHLHPDDEWSEFTGCRYAEMRAQINALKAEYKEKKAKCDECKKFVTAVSQYAKFNSEDPSARAMFRQLNRRIKEVNILADEITSLEFALKVAINAQDLAEKKIKSK